VNRRHLFAVALAGIGCASPEPEARPHPLPLVVPQSSGTTALLQAVSAPSERVVWVSGHAATVLRTIDGGATWQRLRVTPGDTSLEFRDVHALDGNTAWVLAAGPGARSRIYKTADAGRTWSEQFVNRDTSAFYDCFTFWDASHALALSDAVAGRFVLRRTDDGGAHWNLVPDSVLPPAQHGEGGFAASGTCITGLAGRFAWVGTGAADTARVLMTSNRGATWSVVATPVRGGSFAGLATVAFRDTLHGLVAGGNLADANARTDNVAVTADGGRTWTLAGRPQFPGAVYGAAYVDARPIVAAVGPRGLDISWNDGVVWAGLDTLAYWSVGFGSSRVGWAVGPHGRITRIRLP